MQRRFSTSRVLPLLGHREGLLFLLIAFLFLSCEEKPEGLLSKREMEEVLYDYHIAQYMASSLSYEDRYKSHLYVEAVFEKHGITEAQFDTSLIYYNRHTEDMSDIYNHVKSKLEDYDAKLHLESGSNEMRASFTLGGDTADIWSGHRMMILRNNPLLNKETYTIQADTTFHLNDRFKLAVDFDFIREDQNNRDNNLVACLALHYKDGKVVSSVRTANYPSHYDLELNAYDMKEIDHLSCFFLFQGDDNNLRALGIVRDITLYRFHTTDIPNQAGRDTLVVDTLHIDTAAVDTVAVDTTDSLNQSKKHQLPRLNPNELRELSIDNKPSTQIRTAPAVRTPNSIGPRRRTPKKK